MTLYKVYYKSKSGKTGIFDKGFWYVEISDKYGRKKAAMAKAEFYKVHGTEIYEVYRVVRDC